MRETKLPLKQRMQLEQRIFDSKMELVERGFAITKEYDDPSIIIDFKKTYVEPANPATRYSKLKYLDVKKNPTQMRKLEKRKIKFTPIRKTI